MGAPAYTVPKSGCSALDAPQLAIQVADMAATGYCVVFEMSVFQALSAGNITCPPRSPLPLPNAANERWWPAADATSESPM